MGRFVGQLCELLEESEIVVTRSDSYSRITRVQGA